MNSTDSANNNTLPAGARQVDINTEPVELYKILKFEGLVSSGAEAKAAVAGAQVLLNGRVETQKRKKVHAGDTIEFAEEKLFIQLANVTKPTPPHKPS